MMNKFIAILLLVLPIFGGSTAFAINTSEDIETTILNLYDELKANRELADEEINVLQQSRTEYWNRIAELQKETDKAALVLYAQDGGSLFCVGLASDALSNICNSFNKEKVPFENWLQAMAAVSNRYTNIKKALQKIHTEHLPPVTLGYIHNSISICDTLDARFASLRDSITIDQQRYEKLSAEIRSYEAINRKVIDQIRAQIFQGDNENFITLVSSFNYSNMDSFYSGQLGNQEYEIGEDSVENRINKWERTTFWIALISSIILGITLRYVLPKTNAFRNKRWFYALLFYIAFSTISIYVMSLGIEMNDYTMHIIDVCNDSYLFMFWMVLSATIRLKRPGLGWSIAAYAPLYLLDILLINFATTFMRSQVLKNTLTVTCILFLFLALIIIAIGAKRFLKADYPAIIGCIGVIFLATLLAILGYYYPAFILVLFCVSILTYAAAFVCFKQFFGKRIDRGGPILRLTFSHLIYPIFFIFAFMESLDEAANVFNLRTWLSDQMATPFINLPQYGVISASRIILLIVLGIIVNYIIKLIKLILIHIDKAKYETGGHAVAITLCTMITWFCFGILSLIVLQVNHSGVIAAVGGASLGIGFALKETLENLISGLQLMASRARPGDLVVCDGARGVIRHIGILSTQIEIEDGPIVSFPNRQLLGSTFTNLSLNHRREIRHIIFDISADSDIDLAKQLMLDASRDIDGVVDHDKHYVVMRNTNSGIVRLDYKCWIDSARYLRTEPAVREAIFNAFRANGIRIADFSNELGMRLTETVAAK